VKKFILYLIRWQMSTPILAVVVAYFAYLGEWAAAGCEDCQKNGFAPVTECDRYEKIDLDAPIPYQLTEKALSEVN
jgi:hypothetical protein